MNMKLEMLEDMVFSPTQFLIGEKKIHPKSEKSYMMTVIDIAEKGIVLKFPKGIYNNKLLIDSRSNLIMEMDSAFFTGVIHITNEGGNISKNIRVIGTIGTYDRFGTYSCENISINNLICKSDTTLNKRALHGRGVHIYKESKNISIDSVFIENLGDDFIHNHAALAIDGYQSNPEYIKINYLYIKNSKRHGVYLTGSHHYFGEIIIEDFGNGSDSVMSEMQDAALGEKSQFTGLWINQCFNSQISKVKINRTSKAPNNFLIVNLDEGDKNKPVIIDSLILKSNNNLINIEKHTGVTINYIIPD